MKIFIVFCAIVACATAASLEKCSPEEYKGYLAFKARFNRPAYPQDIENEKCVIWRRNVKDVKLNNANPKTHDTAINHLSALTEEEFNKMLGLKVEDQPLKLQGNKPVATQKPTTRAPATTKRAAAPAATTKKAAATTARATTKKVAAPVTTTKKVVTTTAKPTTKKAAVPVTTTAKATTKKAVVTTTAKPTTKKVSAPVTTTVKPTTKKAVSSTQKTTTTTKKPTTTTKKPTTTQKSTTKAPLTSTKKTTTEKTTTKKTTSEKTTSSVSTTLPVTTQAPTQAPTQPPTEAPTQPPPPPPTEAPPPPPTEAPTQPPTEVPTTQIPTTAAPSDGLPAAVDWRNHGYVTAVKNQGICGSCWAFSAIGALEGQVYKKYNTLSLLSEQDVTDCTYASPRDGCNGGWMGEAFDAAQNAGGIAQASFYPYTAGSSGHSGVCQFNATETAKIGVKVSGYTYVTAGDQAALKAAVANIGPIAVGVDASNWGGYSKGVYKNPNCNNPSNINHAVLIVGYDTEAITGQDYWIVKNSWSSAWGMNGFIHIPRNISPQNANAMTDCGISLWALYPSIQ